MGWDGMGERDIGSGRAFGWDGIEWGELDCMIMFGKRRDWECGMRAACNGSLELLFPCNGMLCLGMLCYAM